MSPEIEIELPDLGPDGGDEAIVSEWNVEEGDQVAEGDMLLEVICESGAIEIPSPSNGRLVEQIVEEDEVVRTGDPLAILEVPEEPSPTEDDA